MPYYIHREPAFHPFFYPQPSSFYRAVAPTTRLSFAPYPALALASFLADDDMDFSGMDPAYMTTDKRSCCGGGKCQSSNAVKTTEPRASPSPCATSKPAHSIDSPAQALHEQRHEQQPHSRQASRGRSPTSSPAAELRRRLLTSSETEQAIVHKVALPDGVTKKDVEISLVKSVLHVKGMSGANKTDTDKSTTGSSEKDAGLAKDGAQATNSKTTDEQKAAREDEEQRTVMFALALAVDEEMVDASKISATTEEEERVLVLTLPKKPAPPVKKIAIL